MLFFFFFCRAQHNLKSSLEKCIAVLQLPERERKLFGSLSSIKCSVGSRQGGWSNLLVEAIVILALRSTLVSVLFAPFRGKTLTRLPVLWHSFCPKPEKYGLCLLSLELEGSRASAIFVTQQLQDHAFDLAQCTTTNVCKSTAFPTHISAYQTINIYYCVILSFSPLKSWKDLFSAAEVERDICIICAGSAEKKGTSGGSRKLLIKEICLILFGGVERLNSTIKLQHGDQEPEHIFFQVTEIVLNAVKYEMWLNRIHGASGSCLQLRVDTVWLKWGMNFSTPNKSQFVISESVFTLEEELVNWLCEEALQRGKALLSSQPGYFNNMSLVLGQGSSVENLGGGELWSASWLCCARIQLTCRDDNATALCVWFGNK